MTSVETEVWVKVAGFVLLAAGLWCTVTSLRIVHVGKKLDTQ